MSSKHDPVLWFEQNHGIQFKRTSGEEYASLNGCPFCGASSGISDRFHVWREKQNYWCRQCGRSGFLDELTGENGDYKAPTPEELLEMRVAKLERKQREQERRLTALEEMARCTDHLRYHQQVAQALDYWYAEGMTQATIDTYQLGYCQSCPTYRESASYTIPVVGYDNTLVNIRHRLQNPNGAGKYRPHRAGLGSALFNAPLLRDPLERIIVTEGEKKAIVATQSGFPTVGICGKRNWKREWLEWFDDIPAVFVALDPDATESAERLAGILGQRARVVDLPTKLDDMIVKHGAGQADVERYLSLARPV